MTQNEEYLYRVQWSIHLDAENEIEAAEKARKILLDPENIANVFYVQQHGMHQGVHVDLQEFVECTCPTEVAAGLRDGPLCPYCTRYHQKKDVPF